MLSPVMWNAGRVRILDQTRLPAAEVWLELEQVDALDEAIRALRVRGAPAIGVAAALGCALAAHRFAGDDAERLRAAVARAADQLAATRPTAVNLFWALERMRRRLASLVGQPAGAIRQALLAEAESIRQEDLAACQAIGAHGAALLPQDATVLTHCNAGALATAGHGTALGVIRSAVAAGKRVRVFADETRPLLQGARLTAWELMRDGLEVTLICDNMAGALLGRGGVSACVVGADRIARNGDAANKIGTYGLAVLARRHAVPFYVAAPFTTVDLSVADGAGIPIEERAPEEVTCPQGVPFAPAGVRVWNPAFDVTPAELITALVTERGVIHGPDLAAGLRRLARPGDRGFE
ncbi:MAG TPA: S-methyl-5-thioribose-1-phosphate isomerase [Myxococcota bacterium]|nr:S-methyl-5-thioribose-1-phosphate isomerase [Myxococcota bacterium]HRY95042.1 S-methyl-5-thioribose-1-phosphate isomerase [Myxococcota bacterium]HSA21087.1 S-methyl-5-thioribose-1-phosphate isomerase [Myxococcota bacterium]